MTRQTNTQNPLEDGGGNSSTPCLPREQDTNPCVFYERLIVLAEPIPSREAYEQARLSARPSSALRCQKITHRSNRMAQGGQPL
jgi:hypothetical protein